MIDTAVHKISDIAVEYIRDRHIQKGLTCVSWMKKTRGRKSRAPLTKNTRAKNTNIRIKT
jgi:hypothetical protein